MNEQLLKDVKKSLAKEPLNQILPPGSPRRYDPPGGVKNHNERIRRESKIADNKNLPFTFSKPRRSGRSATFNCDNCGYILSASVTTVGVVCPECKKFATVTEVVDA